MRLISATVRSVRIHRELRVDFDESRTVIGGPNESGKSTFADAIRRALFIRAKSTGSARDEMVSTIHTGHPEVEVEFECGGAHYLLRKRFSGQNGTCTLATVGGSTWFGEEAEARLANLLGTESNGGRASANRLAQQWTHLWVVQGTSGANPLESANTERDALMTHLPTLGAAAVMQSGRDASTADAIATRRHEIFTKSGSLKRDSDAVKAQEALGDCEAQRVAAEEKVSRLEGAVSDHQEATLILDESPLPKLLAEKEQIELCAKQLSSLESAAHAQTLEFDEAESALLFVIDEQTKLVAAERELRELAATLEPKKGLLSEVKSSETAQRAAVQSADAQFRECQSKTRAIRQVSDLLQKHAELLRATETLASLSSKRQRVEQHRQDLGEIRTQLLTLAAVNDDALESLRALDRDLDLANTTLEAMAAGFEVIESDRPITSADRTFLPGTHHVLLEDTDIAIGATIRIRINPGGGASLAEARTNVRDAETALSTALQRLLVSDVETAAKVAVQRRQLEGRESASSAAFLALGGDRAEVEFADASTRVATLRAAIDQLRDAGVTGPLEADIDHAELQCKTITLQATAAERAETSASDELIRAQKSLDEVAKRALELSAELVQQDDQLRDRKAVVEVLSQQQGPESSRAAALREKQLRRDVLSDALNQTHAKIAALQPELMEREHVRIERAITIAITLRESALQRQAGALSLLRSDGTTDPHEALTVAAARETFARDRATIATRRAKAIALLHDLFTEEQRQLADRFSKPLADRATGYLESLYGPGVDIVIQSDDAKFTGLVITRPNVASGSFQFDDMSGGTKEQISIGVRLAMAEILAADHDGTLPVILDDAFAYSDSERVRGVQRMLDLAASRGLQVVVLSCNPADYDGLGAMAVRLSRIGVLPRSSFGIAESDPMSEDDNSEGVKDEADSSADVTEPIGGVETSPERCAVFLTTLRQEGKPMGNLTLRERLGWSESAYEATRTMLISEGKVKIGRGRGGSVILL